MLDPQVREGGAGLSEVTIVSCVSVMEPMHQNTVGIIGVDYIVLATIQI